jgi:hypothetical protein
MQTPLAVQLYEECVKGKTPEQLSADTGISLEGVCTRVFAAMDYFKDHVHEVTVIRIGDQRTSLAMSDATEMGTRTATMMWRFDL